TRQRAARACHLPAVLRAFSRTRSLRLMEAIAHALGRSGLLPKQRMAMGGGGFVSRDRRSSLQFKCWLSLPGSHPISAGDKLGQWHLEPAVDKKLCVLPRHNHIVLLAEIPHNFL